MDFIFAIISLLIGLGVGLALGKKFFAIDNSAQWLEEKQGLITDLKLAQAAFEKSKEDNLKLESDLIMVQDNYEMLRDKHTQLTADYSALNAKTQAEDKASKDKLEALENARMELSNQFKTLANEIFEDKSRKFAEQNQSSLSHLLDPLKTKLADFQTTVEKAYVEEGKDRVALFEQVKQLMALNQALSQDAKDLTQALKGSNKAQGNWGELILEKILERAGLRKGIEYDTQLSYSRDDGSRAQPDLLINLPNDRCLITDSKVSLTAYDQFVNSADNAVKEKALVQHVDSIRAHIKGLSVKNYQDLEQLKTVDFVVMFIPIEPAFMAALSYDSDLFMYAWEKNILLVSPTTLLFVLRMVAYLWRQEAQNRNAQEIASRGAELYDKLVGFAQEMDDLEQRLNQAQTSFGVAKARLLTGKGNVIRQAEMLRELGVKSNKSLPTKWTEIAQEEELLASGKSAQVEEDATKNLSVALIESLPTSSIDSEDKKH